MLIDAAFTISIIMAFGFALLQFSLVLGAPFGEYVLGGSHKVLPPKMRLVSAAFSFIFVIVGLSYLQKAGRIGAILSPTLLNVLLIVYTLFLAYAIIGNGFLTKSKKEKYVMTPLSIIGFVSSVVVLVFS